MIDDNTDYCPTEDRATVYDEDVCTECARVWGFDNPGDEVGSLPPTLPSTLRAVARVHEGLRRGLAESAAGNTVDLGDFTRFVQDELDADVAAIAPHLPTFTGEARSRANHPAGRGL